MVPIRLVGGRLGADDGADVAVEMMRLAHEQSASCRRRRPSISSWAGRLVAELRGANRRREGAAAGVDHQVGEDHDLASSPAPLRANARDAAVAAEQPQHARAIEHPHVGNLEHVTANRRLEQRPAQEQPLETAR